MWEESGEWRGGGGVCMWGLLDGMLDGGSGIVADCELVAKCALGSCCQTHVPGRGGGGVVGVTAFMVLVIRQPIIGSASDASDAAVGRKSTPNYTVFLQEGAQFLSQDLKTSSAEVRRAQAHGVSCFSFWCGFPTFVFCRRKAKIGCEAAPIFQGILPVPRWTLGGRKPEGFSGVVVALDPWTRGPAHQEALGAGPRSVAPPRPLFTGPQQLGGKQFEHENDAQKELFPLWPLIPAPPDISAPPPHPCT